MSFSSARASWVVVPGVLGLVVLALASTNGCEQKSSAPVACQVNGDCPPGDSCVSGACQTGSCASDADCADAGKACVNETCVELDAGADAGTSGPCTEDAQCAGGALCIAGECIAQDAGTGIGCSTSADCPANETCVNAQCTASGGGTGGCTSATDCSGNASGTVCLNGSCGCTSPSDCVDQSDLCIASQCVAGAGGDAGTTGGGGGGGVGGSCTSDSQCSGTTPVCDTTAGQCVPCTSTENMCPNGQQCVTDTCVAGGGGSGGGGFGGGGGLGGADGGMGGTCLPLGASLCSTICGILSGTCDSSGNCCL